MTLVRRMDHLVWELRPVNCRGFYFYSGFFWSASWRTRRPWLIRGLSADMNRHDEIGKCRSLWRSRTRKAEFGRFHSSHFLRPWTQSIYWPCSELFWEIECSGIGRIFENWSMVQNRQTKPHWVASNISKGKIIPRWQTTMAQIQKHYVKKPDSVNRRLTDATALLWSTGRRATGGLPSFPVLHMPSALLNLALAWPPRLEAAIFSWKI